MAIHSILVHGGAGTILKSMMTAEKEQRYTAALQAALDSGFKKLAAGQSALDAVLAAVVSLEDDELFNAGRGAVFAKDKSQELDASIMYGKDLSAGAVAAVKNIRNPILLAHKVMTESEHVMMIGKGAMQFAEAHKIATEPDEYFHTDERYAQWEKMQETGGMALDHDVQIFPENEKKFGTVGAVALDQYGNIAAATSTGGMTNKQFGRVGDTPIIGAGTYANNLTCAISCTGHGEPFIKAVAAYDVSCLMEYKGMSLEEAMDVVVNKKLVTMDGEGGMIGIDAKGNYAMLFNSEGMYRGVKTEKVNEIGIYA